MKKNPRKGKPSEKMGRKATDPAEQNSRKAELPGGPIRCRIFKAMRVETAPLLAASRTVHAGILLANGGIV